MKFLILLTLLAFDNIRCLAQNSSWQVEHFNGVLSFNLPANFDSVQSGKVHAFAGQLNLNDYGFQYYDTIAKPVDDPEKLRMSLVGFISGRASDPGLKGYSALVTDTSLGGIVGLFGKFKTSDSLQFYKQVFYFVTMANDHFYWFYVYSPSTKEKNEEVNYFFSTIKFYPEKVKESQFKIASVSLQKDRL